MSVSLAGIIVDGYCQTHERLLTLIEKLSDTQLHWQPVPKGLSIAFHLWHVARWADYLQAALPGMTPRLQQQFGIRPQQWEHDNLAFHWGFSTEQLGFAQTGMTMPDELASTLLFPEKTILLTYVRNAFVAVAAVVRAMGEDQLTEAEQPQPLTEGIWQAGLVGGVLAAHMLHDNRHLGAIECLVGSQIGVGTATV